MKGITDVFFIKGERSYKERKTKKRGCFYTTPLIVFYYVLRLNMSIYMEMEIIGSHIPMSLHLPILIYFPIYNIYMDFLLY